MKYWLWKNLVFVKHKKSVNSGLLTLPPETAQLYWDNPLAAKGQGRKTTNSRANRDSFRAKQEPASECLLCLLRWPEGTLPLAPPGKPQTRRYRGSKWPRTSQVPELALCLENPMDRGAWRATVQSVTKSQTWLSVNLSIWVGRIPTVKQTL